MFRESEAVEEETNGSVGVGVGEIPNALRLGCADAIRGTNGRRIRVGSGWICGSGFGSRSGGYGLGPAGGDTEPPGCGGVFESLRLELGDGGNGEWGCDCGVADGGGSVFEREAVGGGKRGGGAGV